MVTKLIKSWSNDLFTCELWQTRYGIYDAPMSHVFVNDLPVYESIGCANMELFDTIRMIRTICNL